VQECAAGPVLQVLELDGDDQVRSFAADFAVVVVAEGESADLRQCGGVALPGGGATVLRRGPGPRIQRGRDGGERFGVLELATDPTGPVRVGAEVQLVAAWPIIGFGPVLVGGGKQVSPMIRTSRGQKIIAASPRLASIDTRSARLIRDADREFISVAMTPTWRIEVAPAANAAAVAGSTGSSGVVRPTGRTLGNQDRSKRVGAGVDERERLLEQARGLGERAFDHASILPEHVCE
jgi:hypothetical protein